MATDSLRAATPANHFVRTRVFGWQQKNDAKRLFERTELDPLITVHQNTDSPEGRVGRRSWRAHAECRTPCSHAHGAMRPIHAHTHTGHGAMRPTHAHTHTARCAPYTPHVHGAMRPTYTCGWCMVGARPFASPVGTCHRGGKSSGAEDERRWSKLRDGWRSQSGAISEVLVGGLTLQESEHMHAQLKRSPKC